MFERFGYSAPSHYFDKRKARIMGKVKTLADADVAGKRVLCRVDFNVPLSEAWLPTTQEFRLHYPLLRI